MCTHVHECEKVFTTFVFQYLKRYLWATQIEFKSDKAVNSINKTENLLTSGAKSLSVSPITFITIFTTKKM